MMNKEDGTLAKQELGSEIKHLLAQRGLQLSPSDEEWAVREILKVLAKLTHTAPEQRPELCARDTEEILSLLPAEPRN